MQALDHAAGYLLAYGINAALCKTVTVQHLPKSWHKHCGIDYLHRKEAHGRFESLLQQWDNGSDLSGV